MAIANVKDRTIAIDALTNMSAEAIEMDRTQKERQPQQRAPEGESDDKQSPQVPRKTGKLASILRSPERKWSSGVSSLVAGLPAFVLGITLAYSSNVILDLTGEATELPSEYFFSTISLSIFTALGPVGAIPGGPLGGFIADRWGRKCAMMFCGLPYLVGYLFLSYAHYSSSASVFNSVLFTGRFLTGVGMGWTAAIPPVYISEISSTTLRGIYGNVFVTLITFGILLNYALGAIENFRYYYISLVAVGIIAVYEVLMFWLPETPRWLLSKEYSVSKKHQQYRASNRLREKDITNGRIGQDLDEEESCVEVEGIADGDGIETGQSDRETKEGAETVKSAPSDAEKALLWLRGKKVGIETELEAIKKSLSSNAGHGWKYLDKKMLAKRLFIVMTIFAFQPMGGINVVAPFAGTILSDAGFSNPRSVAVYAVGGAGLVGLVISLFSINTLGRKPLLIISALGQCLGVLLLGVHSFTTRSSLCPAPSTNLANSSEINVQDDGVEESMCNTHLKLLALFGMLVVVLLFNVGFNPVPFILLPELIPLSVRGVAGGIASSVTLGFTALFSGLYFTVTGWITPWITLWGVAILDIASAIFVVVFVPETKGKSLDEFGEQPKKGSDEKDNAAVHLESR